MKAAITARAAALVPHSSTLLILAVLLPRLAWFMLTGGGLPSPVRDQSLYIHTAGRIATGYGFSFSDEIGLLKNQRNTDDSAMRYWTEEQGYVFGLTPVNTPTAVMEPGYPVLLGLFFMVFGGVSGAVFSLNLLFTFAGVFAVRKMAAAVWGNGVGLTAGLLWALYPPYIYYSAYAMTETAHFSLLMVSTMCLFQAGRGESRGFMAGVASGVFFLIRATALFLVPFQLVYLAWNRRWKALLPLFLGFSVAVAPWMVRNAVELGRPVLMPTKGTLNLWMRNNPEMLALEGIHVPLNIPVHSPELLEYPDMSNLSGELERSDALGESSGAFVRRNPRLMTWLFFKRAAEFLAPGGGTLGARGMLAGLIIYPIMLLGGAGLWRNRGRHEVIYLAGLFFLYLAMHAAAHGGVRYRLPVDAVFLLGCALYGLCSVRGRVCPVK
jgi:4-amino-4-deoxy-L-arabinose transferase-like glycosyltransferase